MRPSRKMIALTLVLAALTVPLVVLLPQAKGVLAIFWGGLVLVSIADLILTPARNSLRLEPDLPETGFSGETVDLTVNLAAKKSALPPEITMVLTHGISLTSQGTTHITPPKDATTISIALPLILSARGEQAITRLSLAYASRLGLFEIIQNWPLDLSIAVLPNVNPVLTGAVQTQMLPLLDGARIMNLRGEGSEFHQLRDFVPGMDTRSIDWKRSARVNALVARETRAERNHQIILCLDTGHLMAERLGRLSRLDHSINAALALAWAGALGGDNVGFYSFNSRPQPFFPPSPGRSAFGEIRATCAKLDHVSSETNHTLGLTFLGSKLKRRSLVVVFSDFTDSVTAELLVENLGLMTKQHLVLYITLRDPVLAEMAHPKKLNMESISQGIAAGHLLSERHSVLDRLQRLGVLCLDTAPGNLTPDLISRYIEIKAKEMI